MKTMIGLLLALLPAICLAADPYPAYLARYSTELNAVYPTENWSYWGYKTDPMGWADYYIVDRVNGIPDYKLMIHVPTPGAPLDAAFLGDSTITILNFYRPNAPANPYDLGVLPDLATGNFGIGGQHCVDIQARFAEVAAIAPRTIVIGCGTEDIFWPKTSGLVDAQAALINMMQEGKRSSIPVIIAALPPIEAVLPTIPKKKPSLIAQQIHAFNTWIVGQVNLQVAAGFKVQYWDRWLNLAASGLSDYGAPDCYAQPGYHNDGVHPYYCNERTVAGLRYLIGESEGK